MFFLVHNNAYPVECPLGWRDSFVGGVYRDDPNFERAPLRRCGMHCHVLEWSRESWKQRSGIDIDEKEIAEDFRAEQADAEAWFELLAADERTWIAEGGAVDAKFNQKYREIPDAITTDPETHRQAQESGLSSDPAFTQLLNSLLVVFILAIVAAFTLFVFWTRHRRPAETNLNASRSAG